MGDSYQTIENKTFGYAITLPQQTPEGLSVELTITEQKEQHKLHAETSDQHTVYVEVTAYPDLLDHEDLVEAQQMFLTGASPSGWMSGERRAEICGLFGTTFEFRGQLDGRWKERCFLFVDGTTRTYRLVHDPTSRLSVEALATLQLV